MPAHGPIKLTPEVRSKLEEAAALDCTWEEMAFYAGISKTTLYNWLDSEADLKERLNDLKQTPFLKARTTIVNDLEKTETAKWYLERKKKKEFAQRQELTGADGEPLPTPILDVRKNDSDEQDTKAQEED